MADISRLVGFALDVSGSMAGSIANERGGELGRIDGLRNALDSVIQELEELLHVGNKKGIQRNDRFFAYAFGVRAPGVGACDLFHALEHFDELSALARCGSYRALDLLKGEITYSTSEIVERWKNLRDALNIENRLIGGGTPMRQALRQINDRFQRESQRVSSGDSVLFILSDGEATDGDPVPEAERMKQEGIRVLSCFVASRDIATPRRLPNEPGRDWPRGATNLFEMASTVNEATEEIGYYKRINWTFEPDSRLFAQVNHSEMLTEMFHSVIEPMRLESEI